MRRFSSTVPKVAPLSALLSGFKSSSHALLTGEIDQTWMQGQTTFGGLSAALCLLGARQLIADADPLPLRSAQVAFLGAAGGPVFVSGNVLRRGKSSAFVRAEVSAAGGVATSSTLAFCKSRPSRVDASYMAPPAADSLPPPDACEPIVKVLGASPAFMQNNFDLRVARRGTADGGNGPGVSTWMWARHKGANAAGGVDGVSAEVHLLTLADTPPPALLFLLPTATLETFPNVSSLTWHVDFCDEVEARRSEADGWWLIEGRTETARQGYSAAAMTLWGHRDGWGRGPLAIGRQTIAVYI
jgi:acyl-CoA thioesterase